MAQVLVQDRLVSVPFSIDNKRVHNYTEIVNGCTKTGGAYGKT